ncbi:MAG: CRTAC1 family protein [Anaerolineae bacterium]
MALLVTVFAITIHPAAAQSPNFTVDAQLFGTAPACSGHFVAHDLDHITSTPGGRVRSFQANGAGVAINDLDNDGDLDIVFANYSGPNTILWNDGHLRFRTQHMEHGDSRAATIVDVNGDGLLDITFSRTKTPPTSWRNLGNGRFVREFLSGVGKPIYAINWGDLDDDGDLDLIGATYDASLLTDYGQEFLLSGNGGVYYFENGAGNYHLHALATNAQALALLLIDLNGDDHLDIWVGNDFAVPDQIWYWSPAGWQPAAPLSVMSHSTMSLDFGDINNDGHNEVFSSDMKPYPGDEQGQQVMPAIIDSINEGIDPATSVQRSANILQSITDFSNNAPYAGVDASGWSWSGKFGDLNQDGFLDLYVVNGFAETSTFPSLPDQELVEANQAFMNTGSEGFIPAPEWNLGSTRGGRGMSMADIDGDGDLDIVVNNLNAPAQLFENQLCQGSSLEVDLRWPHSANTYAIGSLLTLYSDTGTYQRDVKAVSGYLSGDANRIHFGFASMSHLQKLEIRWPDGYVNVLDNPIPDTLLKISRK